MTESVPTCMVGAGSGRFGGVQPDSRYTHTSILEGSSLTSLGVVQKRVSTVWETPGLPVDLPCA